MVNGNIATTSRVSFRKKRRSCRYVYDRYNDAQRMIEVAMDHVVIMIEFVVSVIDGEELTANSQLPTLLD